MTSKTIEYKIALKYGAILGLIFIIFEIIRVLTNTHYHTTTFHLIFRSVIFIAGIFMAIYQLKRTKNVQLTRVLVVGVSMSLIIAIITYYLVYTTVIQPDYDEIYSEIFRPNHVRNHPNKIPEQIEDDIKEGLVSVWQNETIFMIIALGGLIVSLIAGLVVKKIRPVLNIKKENLDGI